MKKNWYFHTLYLEVLTFEKKVQNRPTLIDSPGQGGTMDSLLEVNISEKPIPRAEWTLDKAPLTIPYHCSARSKGYINVPHVPSFD